MLLNNVLRERDAVMQMSRVSLDESTSSSVLRLDADADETFRAFTETVEALALQKSVIGESVQLPPLLKLSVFFVLLSNFLETLHVRLDLSKSVRNFRDQNLFQFGCLFVVQLVMLEHQGETHSEIHFD